ncbi:MAG: 4-(cytidine 5'-diphospho)-2-C-methyl-D-erythritol kinase, partial [Bacteroidales bacterium]|nr:4-(cytidine 5'-diphospho)-2-C-methyl-D-erythritol kinase [Bacteroidales bacterium]
GGGSSDGAAALIILNRLFCLGMDNLTLADYASRIGSDCPYFIYANQAPEESLTPMLVSGRGELLEPVEVPALEGISVKIETPNVFISTAEAYRGVVPEKPQVPLRELLKLPLDQWRDAIKNDFEKTLFDKYPQLYECKESFYRKGAIYASMSGSGSSVFGLFAK